EIGTGRRAYRRASARARQGLPDPLTSFSGATTKTAPVGGSFDRLASCVNPYLLAPSRNWWQGNGGVNEWAAPASVPTVSTPTPTNGLSLASHLASSISIPGVCGPVSLPFKNAFWSFARASHLVRLPVRGIRKWRRQLDHRRPLGERLRQVDDIDGTQNQALDEGCQGIHSRTHSLLPCFQRRHRGRFLLGNAGRPAQLGSITRRLLQRPWKLEAVFQHVDVHQEALRHLGLHLGDDAAQLIAVECVEHGGLEIVERAHRLRVRETGRLGDRGQVGAGRGGRGEPAVAAGRTTTDREQ